MRCIKVKNKERQGNKMNVYDTANRLAYEIQQSEEYKQYKKLKDEVMSNNELKNKVEEFEKLRYDVQLIQYTGEKKDEEKSKKLEEMYAMLVQDKQIKEYFDLEVKFNVMIADINKIIAESIRDVLQKNISFGGITFIRLSYKILNDFK